MGNRIYGCDDCQEVCPWNRFAIMTTEKGFHPRENTRTPDLVSLATITPEEFKNRFKNSAILRAKYDGFIRNVVVALGNSRSEGAIPVLEKSLRQTSPLIRAHSAWAMGQIPSPQALQILKLTRIHETDPQVQEEIAVALQ